MSTATQPKGEMKKVSADPADPVYVNAEGHWFYDETWSHAYGPYADEVKTREELARYAATL